MSSDWRVTPTKSLTCFIRNCRESWAEGAGEIADQSYQALVGKFFAGGVEGFDYSIGERELACRLVAI